MRRRPPNSTRPDTPFPYTPLFRSLARRLGGVDRVAQIVAGAVVHEGDEAAAGLAAGTRPQLVHEIADRLHHLDVAALAVAADVVALADAPPRQPGDQGLRVILHVQPVAHVLALAIDRSDEHTSELQSLMRISNAV